MSKKKFGSEQLEGSSSEGRTSESQCCRIQYNSYLCCQIYTQYNPCPYCFETILRLYLKSIMFPLLQFKVSHPTKTICLVYCSSLGYVRYINESNMIQSTSNIKGGTIDHKFKCADLFLRSHWESQIILYWPDFLFCIPNLFPPCIKLNDFVLFKYNASIVFFRAAFVCLCSVYLEAHYGLTPNHKFNNDQDVPYFRT